MHGRFDFKEKLYFIFGAIAVGLLGSLPLMDSTFSNLAINIISDILFAVVFATMIDQANVRDHARRNKSRQRAIALAVQSLYQNIWRQLVALLEDGISSSGSTTKPTKDVYEARRAKLSRDIPQDRMQESLATYFITFASGASNAAVYPPRTVSQYLVELQSQTNELHLAIFHLDNAGLLPDEIVDALTELKSASRALILCFQGKLVPYGFWPQRELEAAAGNLRGISPQVSPHLLAVARRYAELEGVPLTTVSSRALNDGKKLSALEGGADINVKRMERALVWFSVNWPAGAVWPTDVPRPAPVEEARASLTKRSPN